MNIIRRRGWEIPESRATPEEWFFNRREMLKAAGLAHCLRLVHFHVGSQVPDIGTIKRAGPP